MHRVVAIVLSVSAMLVLTGWGIFFISSQPIPNNGTGVALYIAAGRTSGPYNGADGTIWQADEGFSGGGAAANTNFVTNTADPQLYQTSRTSTPTTPFSYTFFLSQGGQFLVSEYEAESQPTFIQGTRVQNITLTCDGTQVAAHNNFDILNTSGPCGKSTAINRACVVSDWINCGTASDGHAHTLVVNFAPVVNNPIVNAVSVVPQKASNLTVPTPIPTPTPSARPQVVQCSAGQNGNSTLGQAISLSVNIPATGGPYSLILFHKGVSGDTSIADTQTNAWTNFPNVGTASGSCNNFDYVTTPNGTGSVTVTFQAPNSGAFNAGTLCVLSNFAGPDVGGGATYAAGPTTTVQSGITAPLSVGTDTVIANYYAETTGNLSGSSTNYSGAGTNITDVTLAGSPSNGTITEGLVSEAAATGAQIGLQRSLTAGGAVCGGVVALSSVAIPISSIAVSCTPNPVTVGSQSTCTATATLANGNTQNVTGQATWASSNTSLATMSGNIATGVAAGTPNITAQVGSVVSSPFALTVQTSSGAFPHLGINGQIVNSFTPGTSIWMRSQFGGAYSTSPYGAGSWNSFLSDVTAAAFNTSEQYLLRTPSDTGCTSSTFALGDLTGTGTGWQTNPCGNWHDAILNGYMKPATNDFNAHGFVTFSRTDAAYQNSPGNLGFYYSCGSTVGSCTNLWPQPSITDYTSELYQQGQAGGIIGQVSPDEFGSGNPFSAATNPQVNAFTRDLGLAGSNTSHVAYGRENQTGDTQDQGNPLYTDYSVIELPDVTCIGTWACVLSDFHAADQHKAVVLNARGPTPMITLTTCVGPGYTKGSTCNSTQYTPSCGDTLTGTWATNFGAGALMDYTMYALAHGWVGDREYQFDNAAALFRANDPAGHAENTYCSPAGAVFSGHNGLGQDRWYADSVAYNMIKAVEPYALQPMGQPPNQLQACDSDASVSTAGDPIICGTHAGTVGGKSSNLVIIMNASPNTVTYQFSAGSYVFTGGTAQEWQLIGSLDGSCGTQATSALNDCIKGPTKVIGASTINTFGSGSVFPTTGEAAPTNTVTLTMQPTEADVFLYHQ